MCLKLLLYINHFGPIMHRNTPKWPAHKSYISNSKNISITSGYVGDSGDDILLSDVDNGRHSPTRTIPNGIAFIMATVSSRLLFCKLCSATEIIRSPGNIALVDSADPPGIKPRTTITVPSGSNGSLFFFVCVWRKQKVYSQRHISCIYQYVARS